MNTDGRIISARDVPSGHHYAVLIFSKESVQIPGDERSRTNPGHGYPAHTETFNTFSYYAFANQKDLQSFVESILRIEPNRKDYTILEVNKQMKVTTKVVVE